MGKEDNLKPAWTKGESGNPNVIWKHIPNYEEYQINNYGIVKSTKYNKEKIIAQQGCSKRDNKYRYMSIKLSKDGISKRIRIHQLMAISFLGYKMDNDNVVIDHINNNGLDNRLINLQLITKHDNRVKDKKPISGVTGVSKARNKWRARIVINKKEIIIGYYKSIEEASNAYNKFVNNEIKTR